MNSIQKYANKIASGLHYAGSSSLDAASKSTRATASCAKKLFTNLTVPKNATVGVFSAKATALGTLALHNWGPVILANGIVRGTVQAGAHYGLPAALCKFGAYSYIAAFGVGNLPQSVIALGGLAAGTLCIGIGNGIVSLIQRGDKKTAETAMAALEKAAEEADGKSQELDKQANAAQRNFRLCYRTATEQQALAEKRQAAAEQATDPEQKAQLEAQAQALYELVDRITREAADSQQEYLSCRAAAQEAQDLVDSANEALTQARQAAAAA